MLDFNEQFALRVVNGSPECDHTGGTVLLQVEDFELEITGVSAIYRLEEPWPLLYEVHKVFAHHIGDFEVIASKMGL